MVKTKTLIATTLIIIVALCVGIITAQLYNHLVTIPSEGYIETEYGITATPDTIQWSPPNMTIGVGRTCAVNLTNTGTRNITALTATYGDETPNLINYTLTWDAEDYFLEIGKWLLANFTLTIYEATEGPFNFNIFIEDKA